MIERLSDLLRITLDKVGIQEVTVAEELEYLRAYLDIEQVHFGERLAIEYHIDTHALDALVPNLVLQPLAENAIRHGLEPRAGKGRLTIEASRRDGILVLRVGDDGRGMSAAAMAGINLGVGVSNTRARLERLYGDRAALTFTAGARGGVDATITLPFKAEGAHEDSSRRRGRPARGARASDRVAV